MTQGPPDQERPRDPDLAEQVLVAALDEYAQVGWTGFTLAGVAKRAGVDKSTLDLRWAGREELLIDAIEANSDHMVEANVTPDTGSFTGDLHALATEMLRYYLNPRGWVALRVAVESVTEQIDPVTFHQRMVTRMHKASSSLLVRAIARGELAAGISLSTILETMFGAVLMHVLLLPPDQREHAKAHPDEHVAPLVEFVLAGIHQTKPAPNDAQP